jgi:restriction system protein
MGVIRTNIRHLRDLILEEVACKSSLLLNDYDANDLLSPDETEETTFDPYLDTSIFDSGIDTSRDYRIRHEDVTMLIIKLRERIGNLPDDKWWWKSLEDWLKDLRKRGIEPQPLYTAFNELLDEGKYKVLDDQVARELAEKANFPLESVCSFLLALDDTRDRMLWLDAKSKSWDGSTPLSHLFGEELITQAPEMYLDQQFLDYLARNPDSLDRIHWRNFERLCAEFFRRAGYEVELGPGRSEGGVDIRVWPNSDARLGPPLLLIQCKRYKRGKEVKVEYVKALWADVHFAGAQRGLLATTSTVAPGGRKICEVRAWPLGIAENRDVSRWIKLLWRHAYR